MQQEEKELGKSSIKLSKTQEKPGVRRSSFQHFGFYGAALWEVSPHFGKILLVWGLPPELHGCRCPSPVPSRLRAAEVWVTMVTVLHTHIWQLLAASPSSTAFLFSALSLVFYMVR